MFVGLVLRWTHRGRRQAPTRPPRNYRLRGGRGFTRDDLYLRDGFTPGLVQRHAPAGFQILEIPLKARAIARDPLADAACKPQPTNLALAPVSMLHPQRMIVV